MAKKSSMSVSAGAKSNPIGSHAKDVQRQSTSSLSSPDGGKANIFTATHKGGK